MSCYEARCPQNLRNIVDFLVQFLRTIYLTVAWLFTIKFMIFRKNCTVLHVFHVANKFMKTWNSPVNCIHIWNDEGIDGSNLSFPRGLQLRYRCNNRRTKSASDLFAFRNRSNRPVTLFAIQLLTCQSTIWINGDASLLHLSDGY